MNNNQKKYRFNIIDVLIILVVIAIGVVMYYYMSARNTMASNLEVEVEYTVELKTVYIDYVDNINIGDKVVETVRDQQIGEVVEVVVSPAYNVATNTETGETYIAYYPQINGSEEEESTDGEASEEGEEKTEPVYEYYNVRVKVRDTFKKSDNGYKKNAFDLSVGEKVNFRVPHFVNEGYCIEIKEIAKEAA